MSKLRMGLIERRRGLGDGVKWYGVEKGVGLLWWVRVGDGREVWEGG